MHHHAGIRVEVGSGANASVSAAVANQRLAAVKPGRGAEGLTQLQLANEPAGAADKAAAARINNDGAVAQDEQRRVPVAISAEARARAADLRGPAPSTVARVDGAAQDRLRAQARTIQSEVDFQFEVTTKDGDTVQVHVNLLDSATDLSARGTRADGTRVRARSHEENTSRTVAIAVQGSLDDGELAAIDKLATGVVDLAQSFLSGDDRGALDKALALNFDASELTTFALHLTQTETQAKTRVKLSGDAALAGLARIDRVFADQTKSLGEALRGLLNEPVGEIDTAARAQLAQQLLPALLAPVADATNATGAAAAA